MYKPKSTYTSVALQAIHDEIINNNTDKLESQNIPEELMQKQACFVSVHKKDGSLRGCIGTIEAVENNLFREIIRNAVAACSHDHRFLPVTKNELNDLEVSVDVLSQPKLYEGAINWDVSKYGIIVEDRLGRKGVLLPNLNGINSAEEQFNIVKKKAGIHQKGRTDIRLYLFTATRYH